MTTNGNINQSPFPAIPGYAKLAMDRYKKKGGYGGFRFNHTTKVWEISLKGGIPLPLNEGVARIDRAIATNSVRAHF